MPKMEISADLQDKKTVNIYRYSLFWLLLAFAARGFLEAQNPQNIQNIQEQKYRGEQIFYRENTEVRIRLQELFSAPLAEVLKAPQTIYSQRDGNLPVMFQVRLNNKQKNKLYYAFVNRSYDQNGRVIYPVSSRGSYLIRREMAGDRIDQIKIFLNRNIGSEQSFIRISPQTHKPYSQIEVVIFGRKVYRQMPLSIPFQEILTMPLRQFLQASSKTIQWNILLPDMSRGEWALVQKIPAQLRPYLYQIPEVYDGAMDVNGAFVRIATGETLTKPGLNCSGFIKWVADGVYRSQKQWQGEQLYLDINILKRRQVAIRGAKNSWSSPQELDRDPYFGLDWARSIAHELLKSEVEYPVNLRSSDVQDIPFFKYFENVGYPVANINAMMYLLAIKNPGSFYLGAINGDIGSPPLHQYYHEVVFFPYFDRDASFKLVLMDTGIERREGFLEDRYKGDFVHLSHVRAPYQYLVAPLNRQLAAAE